MTIFEQRGITFQQEAYNADDAKRKFDISCDICCNQGKHIECDRCIIKNAHQQIMAYFADKEARKAGA